MSEKTIVQVYKRPGLWKAAQPPGIGDFLRGACHLAEEASKRGMSFRMDISSTDFSNYITNNTSAFIKSETDSIASALEDFHPNRDRLFSIIDAFADETQENLYLCSNLGSSTRSELPKHVKNMIRPFFDFRDEVLHVNLADFGDQPYAVLSVRCGDSYFGLVDGGPQESIKARLFRVIEERILSLSKHPLIVMSDSYTFKRELSDRYGLRYVNTPPQHGGFGSVFPVVRDLDLLRRSKFNFHINAWKPWWSGFSHYTSLVLDIPDLNLAIRPA